MAQGLYEDKASTSSTLSKRQRYDQLRSSLQDDRSTWDAHYQELANFLFPRRTRFFAQDRNKGDKRNQHIIDSTARFAARTLQSGLHAGLTSPARPWMKLTTHDPELAEYGPVKAWLHLVTQRLRSILIQTNVYNALPVVYGDMGCFATAAMSVVDDAKDLFRCYTYPVGSYWLARDDRGLPSAFLRDYELTVEQCVETFGVQPGTRDVDWSKFSTTIRRLYEQGQINAPVPVTWAVTRNREVLPGALGPQSFPWSSCHFETGDTNSQDRFLREAGFKTFPIMAPRWDITGEDTYGTDCPGMTALGDVKQLQTEQRRKGQAIAKMVDPPLVGPHSLRNQKTSLLPADVTYVDEREGQKGLRPIHETRIDLQHLAMDIREVQYRIQRAFYEDLFLMLAHSDQYGGTQPPTAREIDERHEEKLLALGPVLDRTNDELLDPFIDRVYQKMDDAGMIPEAPSILQGISLKVEYISIMHQAQKLVGVAGLDRFMASTTPLVELYPEVRAKIDVMHVVDAYQEMLGIDPRIVRETEKAEQLVAASAQQQQAQMRTEQVGVLAKAAKDAAQAPLEGNTALGQLAGGMAGVA